MWPSAFLLYWVALLVVIRLGFPQDSLQQCCQDPSHGGSYMDEITFTLGLDCSLSLFQGTASFRLPLYAFLIDCSRVSDVR